MQVTNNQKQNRLVATDFTYQYNYQDMHGLLRSRFL